MGMRDYDDISVIVPAYNVGGYIKEALESVVHQSQKAREIIVIDDGSTDNTSDLVKSFGYPVRYYYQTNAGAAAARNAGVERSCGQLLAFLDGDDIWDHDKLKKQCQKYQQIEGLDMVFTYVQNFYSPELPPQRVEEIQAPMQPLAGYCPSTFMIKKDAFLRMGEFTTQHKIGEFIDWYAKAQALHLKGHLIDEVLVRRRLHTTNQGILQRHFLKDYLAILRAKLASESKKSGP